MSNMISVASGFQYSVNIGYDLNNDDKVQYSANCWLQQLAPKGLEKEIV